MEPMKQQNIWCYTGRCMAGVVAQPPLPKRSETLWSFLEIRAVTHPLTGNEKNREQQTLNVKFTKIKSASTVNMRQQNRTQLQVKQSTVMAKV